MTAPLLKEPSFMQKKWFKVVVYVMIGALVLSTVAGLIAAAVGSAG